MKKIKKSVLIPLAVLIYFVATAAYFLPRNSELTPTGKGVAVGVGILIVVALWLVLRKKEQMQRKQP
jgi:hypothetical protein